MFKFETAIPEEVGVSSFSILNTLKDIDSKHVPMHSFIIMRHNRLIFEKYYHPYEKDTLHRMFSISKSFTSIAVSLLIAEGKISLDDKICDYYPEYVNDNTHPFILDMTIRNMLEMRTCHAASTYKVNMNTDWVESFFTVAPTHKAGTVFHYDTSAAHTLSALVEKLTGMKMLDYMKDRFLKYIDFSENSYMITDPFGISMGGSGLMATPMDIFKFLYIIYNNGMITCNDGIKRQLLSEDYLKLATSNISDTLVVSPIEGE
ncbi:MAG: beta-lactamase family protein, partial [Butyrivibrio sp.]|nr:beta-lactamase family protein [Butyrivibrio sp.]